MHAVLLLAFLGAPAPLPKVRPLLPEAPLIKPGAYHLVWAEAMQFTCLLHAPEDGEVCGRWECYSESVKFDGVWRLEKGVLHVREQADSPGSFAYSYSIPLMGVKQSAFSTCEHPIRVVFTPLGD